MLKSIVGNTARAATRVATSFGATGSNQLTQSYFSKAHTEAEEAAKKEAIRQENYKAYQAYAEKGVLKPLVNGLVDFTPEKVTELNSVKSAESAQKAMDAAVLSHELSKFENARLAAQEKAALSTKVATVAAISTVAEKAAVTIAK